MKKEKVFIVIQKNLNRLKNFLKFSSDYDITVSLVDFDDNILFIKKTLDEFLDCIEDPNVNYDIEEFDDVYGVCFPRADKAEILIFYNRCKSENQVYKVLVHELLHARFGKIKTNVFSMKTFYENRTPEQCESEETFVRLITPLITNKFNRV